MKGNGSRNISMALLSAVIVLAVVATIIVLEPYGSMDDDSGSMCYYHSKCQSFSEENENLVKGQIVFLGDSITDLYVLDEHYENLSLECYNRGIGGDTTSGVLDRLKVSVYDIEPSVVVLMIGINDINAGFEEDGILERYGLILDDIYANLPGVKIYCMSIIPQNSQLEEYTGIKIDETTPRILSANAGISQLAVEKGATYLDLFSLLADENDHLIREYSDDGIHLNYAGLSVWTNLIKPYLNGKNAGEISYYDTKCLSFSIENPTLTKGQIVFIGDSITDLYVLDDHYSDLSLECYNRGISGDVTTGVLNRLKVSVYDIEPSVVVLMIGTNDINCGLGEEGILERYARILDEIYANLPGVEIYCMSIIPQNSQLEEYTSIRIAETTPRIKSANVRISQLAVDKGATYLDLFPLLADGDDYLKREYSDDGIHLNHTGLAVWTDLIMPYLDGED